MLEFSNESLKNLQLVDIKLQRLAHEVLAKKIMYFIVICGYRNKDDQEKAFMEGKSRLHYPQSKHNKKPAQAIDVAPYPLNWNDIKAFDKLGNLFESVADELGIKIAWGGRWKKLIDRPHIELI